VGEVHDVYYGFAKESDLAERPLHYRERLSDQAQLTLSRVDVHGPRQQRERIFDI